MATGFGTDPVVDGNGVPTSGTTSLDIRKMNGAIWKPGIISGATVGTTANMTYTVAAGFAAIPTGTGEVVLASVPAGSVATSAAGGTTRTDTIYVKQNYPSIEGNADVVLGVAVGTAIPPRSLALRSYSVAPGITKTSSAVVTGGIDYSIPYGASLGVLHSDRNTQNSTFTSNSTWGVKTIRVPTDRLVRVSITTNLSANGAVGFQNSTYTEVYFDIIMDNILRFRWNTPGLSQAHATYHWSDVMPMTAGDHTIGYDRKKTGATPFHHYEVGGLGGTLFWVEDIGPIV